MVAMMAETGLSEKVSATERNAVKAIEKSGVLLVYPIHNRKDPPSLWSSFYPKSEMRWEWDQDGDDRVSSLWHLREELSRSGKVVYAKWYQGRATFFSRELFPAFLVTLGALRKESIGGLNTEARQILSVLKEDSPLSTKQLKLATDLRGKIFESTYERAMKQLWSRLWIVGFGEVDEGAFPSLAVGATQNLFEDLWAEAESLSLSEAETRIDEKLPADSLFRKHLLKLRKAPLTGAAASRSDPP